MTTAIAPKPPLTMPMIEVVLMSSPVPDVVGLDVGLNVEPLVAAGVVEVCVIGLVIAELIGVILSKSSATNIIIETHFSKFSLLSK